MNEGIKMKLKSYYVIKNKFLLALIFFLFAFTVTGGVFSKRVNAVTIDGCDSSAADGSFGFSKCLFGKVVDALPELDIRRTIQNTIVSMIVDVPMQALTEHTWDEVIGCTRADLAKLKAYPDTFYKREGGPRTAVIGINHGDPDNDGPLTGADCEFGLLDRQARGSGSFMAMVSTMGSAIQQKDAMPVNLALFFKDEVKNVPFIGNKVYASPTYNNLPFESLVLGLWKLARNAAYAILSIIMIVIGMMIMVRKKVNPQLVVTIENAIPRVILGIFLITFSYPIGATFISLIEPFKRLGDGILNGMAASLNPIGALGAGSIAVLLWLMLMSIVAAVVTGGAALPLVGVGVGAGVTMIVVFVIYLIVCAIAFFKTLLIMIRMIMATITAPFTFAVGAIPGKEESITNWFKLMSARALSVFAMYMTLSLSGLVLHYLLSNTFNWQGIYALGNVLIVWMMTPFIIIVILGTAIGMPKKVEEMFMGAPKRR